MEKEQFAKYTEEYRKRHPEKVAEWRFRSAWRLVQRYTRENPETAARIVAELEKEQRRRGGD